MDPVQPVASSYTDQGIASSIWNPNDSFETAGYILQQDNSSTILLQDNLTTLNQQ